MNTSNPYLKDFSRFLHERFSDDSRSMSYSDWIMRNTTLNKKPFTMDGYPFQRQILDDMSPDLSVIKPSQVGLTEAQGRKASAFLTRNQGTSLIMALPTEDMSKRVSNTRIMPMLNNDRVFDIPTASKPIRRTDLLQIGNSFLYLVGGGEAGATSIPADFILIDEIDLHDPDIVALYSSRLQNSQYKITQRLSTPTFENYGIDAFFKISNQNEYFIRCPSCNHQNAPRWTPEHIHIQGLSADINDFTDITDEMALHLDLSPDKSYVFCTHCGQNLSPHLADATLREWVPAHPSRKPVGYKITPWATDRLSVEYILNQQLMYARSGTIRRFFNTTLGETRDDSNARLSELEIRACMTDPRTPDPSPAIPVVVGIDMGLTAHLVILSNTTVISFETVPLHSLPDRIEEIASSYNLLGGCIDRFPDTSMSNQIRDMTDRKILPTEYAAPNAPPVNLVKDELGQLSHVRGNRTMMLDEVAQSIRLKRLNLTGFKDHAKIITHHLKSQVRLEAPETPAVWKKTDGQDHFAHALGYALFAIRVHQLQMHNIQGDNRSFFGIEACTPLHNFEDRFGLSIQKRNPM